MTSFNGNEGEFISSEEAKTMITRFLEGKPQGTVQSIFLGKNNINQILSQANCAGLRIYFGQDANGAPQLILVGADGDMNDQVSGKILDRGIPCPTFCPPGTKLH